MVDNIYREQTNEEKKNFIDLRKYKKEDFKQRAIREMTDYEFKTIYEKRQPYCSKCAMLEIDKKIELVREKISRAQRNNENRVEIDLEIDYSTFADPKKFIFVNETDIVEDKLIDGIRQRVITGKYKNYICQDCNSKSSIEIKNREFETEKTKIPAKNKAEKMNNIKDE